MSNSYDKDAPTTLIEDKNLPAIRAIFEKDFLIKTELPPV